VGGSGGSVGGSGGSVGGSGGFGGAVGGSGGAVGGSGGFGGAVGGTGGFGGTGGTGGSGGCSAYSHTINIDGTNDFTADETFATSSSGTGYDGYVTWDATHLYVGMSGPDIATPSDTKLVLIYIGGIGGGRIGKVYNTQEPVLPFPARYLVHWRTNNVDTAAMEWNGAAWTDLTWNFAGKVYQQADFVEFAIPFADIGSPDPVRVHVTMINEEAGVESTWAAVPATSLVDGYDSDYEEYFAFDRLACVAPNTYDPLPSEPHAWINEIHYDNDSTDQDEGVEIAGPSGTNLTGWSVVAYNGFNGQVNSGPHALGGTIPSQPADMGTLWFDTGAGSLENGAPDGVALVDAGGNVVQFLSWEGTFAAAEGPAMGMTSVDVGVSESPTTPVGRSLQLHGTGYVYSDFTWAGPEAATAGAGNNSQTFQ
jgi:hypothetical protein